jgi:hypothetical protein
MMKKKVVKAVFEGRDKSRDRNGWQAKRKAARAAKTTRRAFEASGKAKGWT